MVLESVSTDALDRATVRAHARDIAAQLLKVQQAGHDATEYFEVGSFSRPGVTHRVAISYTADGIETVCDCEAGQNHRVCMHVAAALEASTTLAEPEPTPAVVPAEPNWFKERMDEGAAFRAEYYRVAR